MYPEASHTLLSLISKLCVEYIVGQIDAGAQVSRTLLPSFLHSLSMLPISLLINQAHSIIRLVGWWTGAASFPTLFASLLDTNRSWCEAWVSETIPTYCTTHYFRQGSVIAFCVCLGGWIWCYFVGLVCRCWTDQRKNSCTCSRQA